MVYLGKSDDCIKNALVRPSDGTFCLFSRIFTFLNFFFYNIGSCLHDLMNWAESLAYRSNNIDNTWCGVGRREDKTGDGRLGGWDIATRGGGGGGGDGGLSWFEDIRLYLAFVLLALFKTRKKKPLRDTHNDRLTGLISSFECLCEGLADAWPMRTSPTFRGIPTPEVRSSTETCCRRQPHLSLQTIP